MRLILKQNLDGGNRAQVPISPNVGNGTAHVRSAVIGKVDFQVTGKATIRRSGIKSRN